MFCVKWLHVECLILNKTVKRSCIAFCSYCITQAKSYGIFLIFFKGATSYFDARSSNCKKDCLVTKNSESVDHPHKGAPNISSNHQFDSGPKLCNEFDSSLSPQTESTKLCNVTSSKFLQNVSNFIILITK